VQPIVPHPYICSLLTVAKLDAADAALEASNVVEEPQTLNDHCCASAKFLLAMAASLLPADAQHPILPVAGLSEPGRNLRSRDLRS